MQAHRTDQAAAGASPVTLTPMHAAYVRRALFTELESMATQLANEATAASGPEPGVAGRDAEATYRVTLGSMAEVLDVVGWSTFGDEALHVELERAMRERHDGSR